MLLTRQHTETELTNLRSASYLPSGKWRRGLGSGNIPRQPPDSQLLGGQSMQALSVSTLDDQLHGADKHGNTKGAELVGMMYVIVMQASYIYIIIL